MTRFARRMSESGYMHVILRGVGKQIIFEEYGDYRHFLNRLERYCSETQVKVVAYCLMDNHAHLLIRGEPTETILFMKKLAVSYAEYFNKKYERVGHLFQNRYLSEPVDSKSYLLNVFRYILQNPEKANICRTSDYLWNSYKLYNNPPEFMDLSLIQDIIGNYEKYKLFMSCIDDDPYMDYNSCKHDDEWAKKELKKCLKIPSGTIIRSYSKNERDLALSRLKEIGLSVRQIERLTGINRNIVQRI